MKTINSLCSKLLAFTLALMASVASFAYDEMPPDFKVDGLYYNFLEGDNVEVTHPYRPALPTESASNAATQDSPDDYANLTELTIPSTVTYEGNVYHVTRIGHHAFDQCGNLTSVDIPNSIKSIGIRAFSWCSALASIVLKGGLENIESYAFEYCLGLENISLPNSLMTIGQNAFYNTQWYKNQPNGGVYVGNVFYKYKGDIPQNTSFVIKEGTVSISPYAFVKENYHEDYSLVSVSIPNSVKVIGEGVFYRCRALTSIVIPDGVTTIETLAFHYCKALNSVTCKAVEPPVLGSSVFSVVPLTDATLYVPAESVDAYKNADQWKDFGQILPIEPTTSYKSQWCDTWNVMFSNGSVYPPSNTPYRYQLAKDTVIGERTYTAVVQKEINDALDAPRYVAAVRFTDDRKVYIYYDNAEYLLYDFNVQEGDELEVFAGINNYRFGIKTYKCIVTGVEQYACIGCPATITLHVPNHPDDFTEIYRRTQWQEGVGDVYSGFLNGVNGYVPVDGGGSVHLLCAYQGDELKYTGDLYEEYGCGDDAEQSPEDLFPTLWGLQQTICSGYYGEEGDEWASGLTGPSQEITMMDGKPYLQWGSWYLREENDKILVYSEIQKKDLVLYDFTLELGDTLTTLNLVTPEFLEYEGIVGIVDYPLSDYDYTYPIDTLVVTELSKETLLDGKEYTRWKFSDGTVYVEGIGSMSETFFHHIADHLPVPVSYLGSYLVCVSKNNKLLYQMDDAEMERLGTECLCDVETSYKDQWCNKWNVMFFDGMRFDETASTSKYRLGKDTIIGDYVYSKFTSRTSVRFTDDRKVYVYYEGFDDNDPYTEDLPTGEYLAYDFSAQVGDTLEVFSGIGTYSTYSCVVDDVETAPSPCVVDDVQADLKTFPLIIKLHSLCDVDGEGNMEISSEEITWIEGVGSPEGFLISSLPCGWVGGGTYALLCAYKGDELKYTGSLYDEYGCEYNATEQNPEDLFPTLWGLQRTEVEFHTDGADAPSLVSFEEYTPTFVNGKWYLYDGRNYLREENNQVLLYSPHFEIYKDIVLYDWTLEVGDTLPYYFDKSAYKGAYYVVTNVSTITLLDGKEYKKWTLACGIEYIEGIGAINGEGYGHYLCLQHWDHPATYIGNRLVCASRNGQLLYQMDDAEIERLGAECLCEVETSYKSQWCDTWNVLQHSTGINYEPNLGEETWIYYLAQDTIINNHTYTSVYRYWSIKDLSTSAYYASVRFTEDKKVYVYYDDKEYLVYDFLAQVGDTLEVFGGYHYDVNNIMPCVVQEVKTDSITNRTLMKLYAINVHDGTICNGEFDAIEWIEGVGSTRGFLTEEHPCVVGGLKHWLLCAHKGDELKYTGSLYEKYGCEYNAEAQNNWSDTWCNQWNILSHGYQGPQYPLVAAHTSIFWLSNNTVNRDGQEYIPLMCSSSKPDVESTNLIGELRFTEDKQVYFYYDNTEYLLYDFDVQVGDTLDIFGGIELYSYSFVEQKTYPHVITKIDTLDDGRLQITSDAIVIFEDSYGAFEEKMPQTWIEGLGSINGIVHTGINPGIAGNPAIVMLCAYRDDECVYKTDSNDPYWIDYTQLGCVYNAGDFIEGAFPMLFGLQRTICNEYCEDSKTSLQKFDEIRFEHDQPYIYCESAFLIREENNKILIYSHSLDKDLVLYDFTLEVGDSLPRLYLDESAEKDLYWIYYNIMNVVDYHKDLEGNILPADTLIVTDVSAITLLDGKEYKKWTFNNGMEYVEGIGSFGNNMWFCDFFQLIGNMEFPVSLHGTHLVCVSKNNKLLYQMDAAEMERLGTECLCDYDRGPRKDNAKDGQIGGRPTPTQWNQLELDLREMENGTTILRAETFSYTLENDSIVANDKIFYQLARQSTKDTATTKSFVGALHFGKDEDNRVYFLRDGVEYVLYDFTAEIGDTVEIFAGINNYPQETTYTHVVVDKDTTEDGACRMFLEVVFPEDTTTATNAEKVWLAGLGSVDGIVHNAAKRTSNAHAAPSRTAHSSDTQTSVMLCAWREDSCLYTTDHPDYNDIGCIYNQDPTAIEDTHSPSPIADYQKLLRDGQLLIIHKGKTYNVLGVPIK